MPKRIRLSNTLFRFDMLIERLNNQMHYLMKRSLYRWVYVLQRS